MKNRGKMRNLRGFDRSVRIRERFLVLWTILLGWIQLPAVFAQENAVVKRSESSIVAIRFYDDEGRILHQGTGFYISTEGDVITKLPLVKGVRKADLRTNDGMLYPVKEMVSEDKEINLILENNSGDPKFSPGGRWGSSGQFEGKDSRRCHRSYG